MHVLFVAPEFPSNQRQFVRGLHAAGGRVTGIGEAPFEALDGELQHWLYRYEQIGSVVDEQALLGAVRRIQEREWVDRLEATVEAHIMTTAKVREATGIPGTSVRTAHLCRDKPAMKEALRQAGIPCAQSAGVASLAEMQAFAAAVGYPLIAKPRDGAGAAATSRIDDDHELAKAAHEMGVDRGVSIALEEFMEGHEGFYDTLCIDGKPVHDFATHYYPGVLEAMRTRWISPQFVMTNRIDIDPGYGEARELGARVIEVLGIGTSATHMEWFFGPKGLKFSEIGCRPPGVGAWDLYCAGNEMDLYRAWAEAIIHGRSSHTPSRRFAAGIVTLRPDRDGRITGYEGLEEVLGSVREWVIDSHFPAPGSPTQPVEAGYMANAWIRLRHPDFDELRRMLDMIGERVQVRAG